MDIDVKLQLLAELQDEYRDCQRCGLCAPKGRQRKHVVFGDGNPNARLMIIGEAPGAEEDRTGIPFHPGAPAGGLLEKFLRSFNSSREEVYITNAVMCRPTLDDDPDRNRPPTTEEIEACSARLHRMIEIIDPHVLLILGDKAMKALKAFTKKKVTQIAGDRMLPRATVRTNGASVVVERPAIVTFHPSYLLRSDSMEEGGDMHMAYLAWQKAIGIADTYNQLYYGITPPNREVE